MFISVFETEPANFLFKNNGDGTFTNVADQAGVKGPIKARMVSWSDYNNDNWPDLIVSGQQGFILYRNVGNGIFINANEKFNTPTYYNGLGNAWGDQNNDGFLDLAMANDGDISLFFLNNQNGSFSQNNSVFLPSLPVNSISPLWFDVDNDGFQDYYVKNYDETEALFLNSNGESLIDITQESGLHSNNAGCSAAWGDMDNDGDADLIVSFYESNHIYYYENQLDKFEKNQHWLDIDLIGSKSNRMGLGAKVKLYTNGKFQYREKNCGEGCFVQSSPRLHFGLGDSERADSLFLEWPSGLMQAKYELNADQRIIIRENNEYKIFLWPDTLTIYSGHKTLLPLKVNIPSWINIHSFEATIKGFDSRLRLNKLITDANTIIPPTWRIELNNTDSLVAIKTNGSESIHGSGVLLFLEITASDSVYGDFPIKINSASFDSTSNNVIVYEGLVHVLSNYGSGDVDSNGIVQEYDATLILKHLTGEFQLTPIQKRTADVSLDGSVSALDASIVLKYVNGIIKSLPFKLSEHSAYHLIVEDGTFQPNVPFSFQVCGERLQNINAFELEISYDPSQLMFLGFTPDSLAESFYYEYAVSSGAIHFVCANPNPITCCPREALGKFFFNTTLSFNEAKTTITITHYRFNEDPIVYDPISASFLNQTDIYASKSVSDKSTYSLFNYPNPFNSNTTLEFSIPSHEKIIIKIYDILGNSVYTLAEAKMPSGNHRIQWNATNSYGQQVPSGIYLCKFQAGTFSYNLKLLVIR